MVIDLKTVIDQKKFALKRKRRLLDLWTAHCMERGQRLSDNEEILKLSREIDALTAAVIAQKNAKGPKPKDE